MKKLVLAMALLASGAAAAQTVDVGTGNWDRFPEAGRRGVYDLSDGTMDAIEAIGRAQACQVPGLGRTAIDLRVPVALRFDSRGQVERIVIRDIGCPALEQVLGRTLRGLAIAGEFRPTGGAGWYRSAVQFANR